MHSHALRGNEKGLERAFSKGVLLKLTPIEKAPQFIGGLGDLQGVTLLTASVLGRPLGVLVKGAIASLHRNGISTLILVIRKLFAIIIYKS